MPEKVRQLHGYDWFPNRVTNWSETKKAVELFGIIDPDSLKLTQVVNAVGQEHLVYTSQLPEFSDRVIKITQGDSPGVIFRAGTGVDSGKIVLDGNTLASEYCQRIYRQNVIFGDDVKILGVVRTKGLGGLQIVTSQPFRRLQSPTLAELTDYMADRGFQQVDPAVIKNDQLRQFSYYNPELNLLVSDAKPANFVITNDDATCLPIDVICQRPTGEFLNVVQKNLLPVAVSYHQETILELNKIREKCINEADTEKRIALVASADALIKGRYSVSGLDGVELRREVRSYVSGEGAGPALTLRAKLARNDTIQQTQSLGHRPH